MTIKDSIDLFITLKKQTSKKSELKVYNDFIHTLTRLHKRDLSAEDLTLVEVKLDDLKLKSNTNNERKYYKKSLHNLKEYLNKEFSLVSKGHYTAIGMCLGMCFGVALGTVIEKSIGTSSGLVSGMLIGICIGAFMDTNAEKEGNVL
jgi:hypothetical protein